MQIELHRTQSMFEYLYLTHFLCFFVFIDTSMFQKTSEGIVVFDSPERTLSPLNMNREFFENFNYFSCLKDIISSLKTAHDSSLSFNFNNNLKSSIFFYVCISYFFLEISSFFYPFRKKRLLIVY